MFVGRALSFLMFLLFVQSGTAIADDLPSISMLSLGCDGKCVWWDGSGLNDRQVLRIRIGERRHTKKIKSKLFEVRGSRVYLLLPRPAGNWVRRWQGVEAVHLWLEEYLGKRKYIRSNTVSILPDGTTFGAQSMEQSTGLRLVMFDGFNEGHLRTDWWSSGLGWPAVAGWKSEYPPGWPNRFSRNRVKVRDGILMTSCRDRPGYQAVDIGAPSGFDLECGMVRTEDKFFGRRFLSEVSMAASDVRGTISAIWWTPNAKWRRDGLGSCFWLPEKDDAEIWGKDPTEVQFTNHWNGGGCDVDSRSIKFRGPDFSEAFNTFGSAWWKDRIDYYLNGEHRGTSTDGIPDDDLMLVLSTSAGKKWGKPVDYDRLETDANAYFDWVAVYAPALDNWDGVVIYGPSS